MAKVQESPGEPTNIDAESIFQEYREKLNQALEAESGKLKEKAERDSKLIIAMAREEADKAVAQAKQEAEAESERIIFEAKEEAERIAREYREKTAEARQESARVLSETREKVSQVITEVIERGTTHARTELDRVASEALSQTSRILTRLNQSIEQIIGETETNVRAELESLSALVSEAEMKLQPLSEICFQGLEETSQQETEEEVTPAASVREKTEPVVPSTGNKRGAPVNESDDARLFKGYVKLEIVPPFNQDHSGGVPELLARLPGLRITSKGTYAKANRRISTHDIDLEHPMPLLKIIKTIPPVKNVDEREGNIVVTLK